jgi:hypothetical protein
VSGLLRVAQGGSAIPMSASLICWVAPPLSFANAPLLCSAIASVADLTRNRGRAAAPGRVGCAVILVADQNAVAMGLGALGVMLALLQTGRTDGHWELMGCAVIAPAVSVSSEGGVSSQ